MIPSGIYPYSMVKFQEGKYVDETEITVEQWAEFVYDGHHDRKPDAEVSRKYKYHQVFYPSASQDSLFRAFGNVNDYQLPVPFEYFDTLNYQQLREILDFPITGISHEDALAYCNWRTEKYNLLHANHTDKRIEFVLPDSVVYLIELPVNPKKYQDPEQDIFPVKSRKHALLNGFKVYGLQSNVPEMTAVNGQVYGGDEINQLPGFRCVAIVK